jgi:predicted dehydrogenase
MALKQKVTRRGFLRTTGALAAASVLTARNHARAAGANNRFQMGVIGCGGIATGGHLPPLLKLRKENELEIIAVCDIYDAVAKNYADKVKSDGGEPKVFHNFKDVLAIKDLDYIVNATPEHQHAHITIDALDAGKHVYCQKPMTHTIEEGQRVLAKAKATGLKLQVGVQGTADDSYISALEAIKAGKIGPVIEAQIEYVRNYKGPGPWRAFTEKYKDPKPADLDWEAWQGPAPKHDYDPARYWDWRCYRDYSGGIATDLFVHRLTRILKACGLSYPERVVGMGGIYLWPDGRDLPDNFELLAEYPKVEDVTPGMTVRVLGTMANDYGSDHCIRGHEGTIVFTETGWDLHSEGKQKKVTETYKKKGGESIYLHTKNFHDAIRSNAPLQCPPELGLYGVVAVCMANQSWFEKKMMHWNADKGIVASA